MVCSWQCLNAAAAPQGGLSSPPLDRVVCPSALCGPDSWQLASRITLGDETALDGTHLSMQSIANFSRATLSACGPLLLPLLPFAAPFAARGNRRDMLRQPAAHEPLTCKPGTTHIGSVLRPQAARDRISPWSSAAALLDEETDAVVVATPPAGAPAAVQQPASAAVAAGVSGGRESPRTIIGARLCLAEIPTVPAAARWLSSAAAAAALTAGVMLASAAVVAAASAAGRAGNHAVVSPAARAAAAPPSTAGTAGASDDDEPDAAGAAMALSSALHLASKRACNSRTWAVKDLRSWDRSPSFFAMRELRIQEVGQMGGVCARRQLEKVRGCCIAMPARRFHPSANARAL